MHIWIKTEKATINSQYKSEDSMNTALVITLLILIRLVIPFGLLLLLGTVINRRQVQLH